MNIPPGHLPSSPLVVEAWLNTEKPLQLEKLKGKVVVIHAFQMLCPGCVTHGIPQANSIYQLYQNKDVQVIGLHTVFEHHDVMTRKALTAFIHEYQIPFPIAIDKPSGDGVIPKTMSNYKMRGTPTLIILDKNGYIRLSHFGQMSDMQVGSIIGSLLEESFNSVNSSETVEPNQHSILQSCDEEGCAL